MPAKNYSDETATTAAEIDRKLPRGFYVRRGDVRDAFSLSEENMTALVDGGVFKAIHLPPNKSRGRKKSRALFVRSQVMAVARNWEGEA